MSFRRKILLVVFGFALGAAITGGVAGLPLWYVRVGAAPFLAEAPQLDALLHRGLWLVVGITGALALGAALAGRWLLTSFEQSLQVLQDAVEQVRTGRLDTQVSVTPDDELRRLAQALNRMTTTLSQQTVSRDYLQAVLDSMAEFLFVVAPGGRIRRANAAAAQALGRSASTLRGTALDDHFDTDPLSSSEEGAVECTLTPTNGPERPVLVSRSALEQADATQGTLVCVAQDISKRKATEEKLRRSLEEKEVLLREIHHRVKNNLQVISSLLNAQARDVESPAVEERFTDTQDRIRSMASIHEQLYQSDDLARVEFDVYLEGLLDDLFRSHRAAHIDRTLEADALPLSVDEAIPAGLIVNELVSNALEHAFPEGRSGTVTVTFHADGGTARLTVSDNGRGADGLEENGSLGLRLVHGLTRQLRGTLCTDLDDGVSVTITFPTNPSS